MYKDHPNYPYENYDNEERCPLDGDETDCQSCVYYPDYKWDSITQDCVINKVM